MCYLGISRTSLRPGQDGPGIWCHQAVAHLSGPPSGEGSTQLRGWIHLMLMLLILGHAFGTQKFSAQTDLILLLWPSQVQLPIFHRDGRWLIQYAYSRFERWPGVAAHRGSTDSA